MNGIKMQQKSSPKVTVVTVTYNAQEYLEQTIKSVIEQDYPNIEYIIIDGASRDGTIDIIKKYEQHIAYWISEPDKGIYDAMNKSIDTATGEWINFMNAGDSFYNYNVLSKIFNVLDENIEIIYGDTQFIYPNEADKEFILKAQPLINALKVTPSGHQSFFLKTSLMKKYKFDTFLELGSDRNLMIKLSKGKYNYKILPFIVSKYLQNDEGACRKNRIKTYIEMISMINKYSNNQYDIYNSSYYKKLCEANPNIESYNSKAYVLTQQLDKINKFIKNINEKKYSSLVLYGFGNLSKLIYQSIKADKLYIVDKNFNEMSHVDVYSPNILKDISFDKIIITVLGREESILQELKEKIGIDSSKIITLVNKL